MRWMLVFFIAVYTSLLCFPLAASSEVMLATADRTVNATGQFQCRQIHLQSADGFRMYFWKTHIINMVRRKAKEKSGGCGDEGHAGSWCDGRQEEEMETNDSHRCGEASYK